jgi:hypothetical protein
VIFISLSVYALAKELGADDAVAEVHRQLAELASLGPSAKPVGEYLPACKAIARLRLLEEIELRVDAGATCIGKARSRAFHAFRKSAASTWVSIDDDVDATTQTLGWLLEAVARSLPPTPRICLAPCLLRGPRQEPTLNVELPQVVLHRKLSGGGLVRNCNGGGFGLVALNRAAVDHIVVSVESNGRPELGWLDDDKEAKIAVFHDELSGGQWWGEDRSFFRRVPKGVDVECLAAGVVAHDGAVLDLSKVPELGAPF